MALYFDDKTGLLSKFETLGTDPFTGDTVTETIFTGYRNEGARPVPDRQGNKGRRGIDRGDQVYTGFLRCRAGR